ncbi:MAG: group 1 truncated hemoglobin [Acidobacteria bacterium]|uniref:Group 1 truncated hemoglobin n=1 Tax=Candidatus Polarisedimenticola svalbardensis TaxID=2886004 RepID=A0A8J7CF43_9BACT|nr:group 1 truncated hemoglobin [Candidatus Polarisedimenticola svalbardensis]
MKSQVILIFLMIFVVGLAGCAAPVEETEEVVEAAEEAVQEAEPTPDEQVAELDTMCAGAAEAMAARQAESTLFDRVGGRDGIHAVVADTVARHQVNDTIVHTMEGVDAEHLIAQVTEFLVGATGGEGEYAGRNMVDAHAHMGLANVHFLAAGGDLGAAMDAAGWGEDEKQELLCAFVGLRSQVVTQ